jgi:hypothetical protein
MKVSRRLYPCNPASIIAATLKCESNVRVQRPRAPETAAN